MLKFTAVAVTALVLGINCGTAIGNAIDSKLVGSIGGFICFVVIWRLLAVVVSLIEIGVCAIGDKFRHRRSTNKSKYI